MKTKKINKIFLVIAALIFIPTSLAGSVTALTAQELKDIERDKSYFYNPNAKPNTSNNYTYLGYSSNTNYRGDTVWSESELAAIAENRPFYEAAANEYGLPWQILAVIHYQEHSLLRTNPSNGEGIYQLTTYTNKGQNANRFEPTSTAVSDDEFARQTNLAAKLIKENYAVGLDLSTDAGVKNLFYNYNGHGGTHYKEKALALGFSEAEAAVGEGSPYVMNRFDEQRDPLSENMNPAWRGIFTGNGVYNENVTDSRFGAYVHYITLSNTDNCPAATGNEIADTALKISKHNNTSSRYGDTTPSQAYVEAMKAVGGFLKPNGIQPEGASCDQFVGTVLRYSGADPNFPIFGPLVQKAHMDSHPEMYQKIAHNYDVNNLQDGDILVAGDEGWRHILIYVHVDGKPGQAAASYGNRTGHNFTGIGFRENGREYTVYRRINL